MAIFWIIFWQEILIYRRNFGRILAGFLLFFISVSIFLLIASNQQNQAPQPEYLLAVIWFCLLSSLVFSLAEFCKKDFEDGSLEQISLHCANFEIVILAKALAAWIFNAAPIFFCSLLMLLGQAYSGDFIAKFSLIFFLASASLSFICAFSGSLASLGNSAPMIAIVALPLASPTLLIAHSSLIYDFSSAYKILAAICVLSGVLAIFSAAKIIKIAGA
jgi:heme exporter protein CcmB